MYVYIYIYIRYIHIYIYIERERYVCIYIYIYYIALYHITLYHIKSLSGGFCLHSLCSCVYALTWFVVCSLFEQQEKPLSGGVCVFVMSSLSKRKNKKYPEVEVPLRMSFCVCTFVVCLGLVYLCV